MGKTSNQSALLAKTEIRPEDLRREISCLEEVRCHPGEGGPNPERLRASRTSSAEALRSLAVPCNGIFRVSVYNALSSARPAWKASRLISIVFGGTVFLITSSQSAIS